jgi:hypothetical protein
LRTRYFITSKQERRHAEADQRRNQQRQADIGRLRPVDAAGGAAGGCQELVGKADADDRADQRVRAGGGQAEIPGAEVPEDRGNQQREDHGKAGAGADLQDQLHRQQRHDAEGDGAARGQTPRKLKKPDQMTANSAGIDLV